MEFLNEAEKIIGPVITKGKRYSYGLKTDPSSDKACFTKRDGRKGHQVLQRYDI